MCRYPVGLGAKRVRTIGALPGRVRFLLSCFRCLNYRKQRTLPVAARRRGAWGCSEPPPDSGGRSTKPLSSGGRGDASVGGTLLGKPLSRGGRGIGGEACI